MSSHHTGEVSRVRGGQGREVRGKGECPAISQSRLVWEDLGEDIVEKKEVTGNWCREQSVKLERKLFLSHPVWQAQVGATGSTWPSLSWKEGGSSPMQCTPYLALALN